MHGALCDGQRSGFDIDIELSRDIVARRIQYPRAARDNRLVSTDMRAGRLCRDALHAVGLSVYIKFCGGKT